ncbi:MAG: hypothetical protein ACE37K_12780 [Planctomycetota bacterium]
MKPPSMLGSAALTMLFASCGSSPADDVNATASVQLVLNKVPD